MLLRSVVDVAFEPAAFGVVRGHDPPSRRPQLVGPDRQLVDPLLELARQTDVAADDAGLGHEVLQELVLGAGERFPRQACGSDLARTFP